MKTYIYPENLRATVKLWFWNVRDFIIICGGCVTALNKFGQTFQRNFGSCLVRQVEDKA